MTIFKHWNLEFEFVSVYEDFFKKQAFSMITGIGTPKSFIKIFMWNVVMSYRPPAMEKATHKEYRQWCVDEKMEKANAII